MTTVATTLSLSPGEIQRILQIEERAFSHPWTLADFEWLSQDARSLNLGLWQGDALVGYAIGTVEEKVFHLASLAVVTRRFNGRVGAANCCMLFLCGRRTLRVDHVDSKCAAPTWPRYACIGNSDSSWTGFGGGSTPNRRKTPGFSTDRFRRSRNPGLIWSMEEL